VIEIDALVDFVIPTVLTRASQQIWCNKVVNLQGKRNLVWDSLRNWKSDWVSEHGHCHGQCSVCLHVLKFIWRLLLPMNIFKSSSSVF